MLKDMCSVHRLSCPTARWAKCSPEIKLEMRPSCSRTTVICVACPTCRESGVCILTLQAESISQGCCSQSSMPNRSELRCNGPRTQVITNLSHLTYTAVTENAWLSLCSFDADSTGWASTAGFRKRSESRRRAAKRNRQMQEPYFDWSGVHLWASPGRWKGAVVHVHHVR